MILQTILRLFFNNQLTARQNQMYNPLKIFSLASILRLFFNNQLTARQNQMYNPLKIFSLA